MPLAGMPARSATENVGLQGALVPASTITEESNMGDIQTGAGNHEDAEFGLSEGSGGGSGMDFPCPFCGATCEHIRGYGFGAPALGAYTYCGSEPCGKLIEFAPDLEGLDEATAARIQKQADEWRATVPTSEQ